MDPVYANTVTLAGFLWSKPKLVFINDAPTTSFKIFVHAEGKRRRADYFVCKVWGERARWLAENCPVKSPILIVGALRQSVYQDKNTGSFRSGVFIDCRQITPLGRAHEPPQADGLPGPQVPDGMGAADSRIGPDDVPEY
jgi:single-stranded DNA-binding protein